MKAYWIAKVNVDDKKAYAEYAKRVTLALAKYNGKFLVRGGKFEILEGKDEYERNVVIEFPSVDIAKKFYNSEEYQEAKSFRDGKADFNAIVIEGLNTE
tara:strand:- start:11580 stop:11876 length:297 start_codon:yes stop_codon:yes gene_type:complete